jgi:hypothetical protein
MFVLLITQLVVHFARCKEELCVKIKSMKTALLCCTVSFLNRKEMTSKAHSYSPSIRSGCFNTNSSSN